LDEVQLLLASGVEPSGHVVIGGCSDDVDGGGPNVDAGGGGGGGGGCSAPADGGGLSQPVFPVLKTVLQSISFPPRILTCLTICA